MRQGCGPLWSARRTPVTPVDSANERKWQEPPVDWWENPVSPTPSRKDMIVLLGRGTPRRTRTLLEGRRRIPPGHKLLRSQDGTHRLVRLWSALNGEINHASEPTVVASELRDVLSAEVRRLAAGRRVGVLLSGGFDSTLIVRLLRQAAADFRCYVIEHEGRGGPKEARFARLAGAAFGVPVERVVVTPTDLWRASSDVLAARQSPSLCWVIANQYIAAQAAKADGCDVLMLGLGSDELFGGYHRPGHFGWAFERAAAELGAETAWQRALGAASNKRSRLLYLGQACPFKPVHLSDIFPDVSCRDLLEEDVVALYDELHGLYPDHKMSSLMLQLELELRSADVLIDELNTASLLAGVPSVYPFLEQAVVEYAAGIPIFMKYVYGPAPALRHRPATRAVDKYILRLAFGDLIPAAIQRRPRRTYTVPVSVWIRGGLRDELSELILDSPLWERIDAKPQALMKIVTATFRGDPWGAAFRFWTLYQLALWWEMRDSWRLGERR